MNTSFRSFLWWTCPSYSYKFQPNFDNLKRIGNRDVEKLLVCISGGKAKKDVQYLRLPGNCIEAIGALRRYGVDGWAGEGGTQLVPLTPFAC